jgi:hypothetical protein
MAGLLDGGLSGDDTVKDEYGQTQADRRKPLWSGLINAGLLAVAGGQDLMPAERAKYIAAAGGALGGIGPEMANERSQSMQNLLRAQQMKTSGVELQGKQADLAQAAKWRAYADSPEFKAAMDSANATPAERMAAQAAAQKGDFATVAKVLDPKRNMPDVKGDGTIRLADGSVINSLGQTIIGPGGKVPEGGPGAGAGGAGMVKLDEVLAPSKVAGRDDAYIKQVADQYGPVIAKQVRDIADYKVPLPISARTAASVNPNSPTAQILRMVTTYAPDWQQGDFANQNKLWDEFYGKGKTAGNITALDTAYGHLGTFYDAAKALDNPDSPAAAAIINYARTQLGHPEVTNAHMAMLAVGHELAKVFRDAGMSAGEIESWEKQLSPNMSPQQIQGAVEMAQKLMEGRVEALQTRYERGSKGVKPGQWFTQSHVDKAAEIKANPLGGKPAEVTPTASSYTGPDGATVSIDQINATAKARNMSPADVISQLGLKPVK